MSDEKINDLLRRAPFSFVGTIEHLVAATMDLPIDDHTAVVYVDRVLSGPEVMLGLGGRRITLQLAAGTTPPDEGETTVYFVEVLAFGDSVAVAEVGHLPLADVEPEMRRAADAGERAFDAIQRRVEAANPRRHAAEADAVVLGRVVKLEVASSLVQPGISEHDPDWWVATLMVYHVERGDVKPGKVKVLYANSIDVRWRDAPKPKASESGLWLLHRAEGERGKVAPFEILHKDDCQPVQSLDAIREYGS